MIEINLLPKDFQKKPFDFSIGKAGLYAVAAAAGIIIMLIGITFYQGYQISKLDTNIERARQRAAMLQEDIKLVDALMDVKGKITSRMRAVEKLDSHRSAWVRILEDVARNIPEFVWLSRFKEKPQEATGADEAAEESPQMDETGISPTVRQAEIEGYAFTLNALASFMIKMMRSDYFDEVELVTTNEVDLEEQRAFNFVLTFNVHYLSDEELRGMIAAAAKDAKSGNSSASHKSLN